MKEQWVCKIVGPTNIYSSEQAKANIYDKNK